MQRSNRIGVVFALDRILGKMLVGDDVNSLIAAFLSDFYMVKTLSSQHLCASVLIFMSVHLVKFLSYEDARADVGASGFHVKVCAMYARFKSAG